MAEVIIGQRIIEQRLRLRPEQTEPKAAIKDPQNPSNELFTHPFCVVDADTPRLIGPGRAGEGS